MAKLGASSGKSLGIVLLVLFLSGACSRGEAPPGAGAPQGVPVKLQEVETGTIEESTEIVGSLEADQSVVLRPVIEGRVTQIFASQGSRVAAGAPIVQLKPDKGQAEVRGAIANVNAQRAALNNAQAQISAAEAERVSAVADLQLQNEQFERISTLVAQGAFARQQLDQVRRDRDAARADLNAAEERVQAARATLDQENSALQETQAQASVAGEELQDTRVVAPIAGVVGDVTVKLGDFVNTSSSLTTIIQNQTLSLNLTIPIERASQLRVGLPVQLTGPKDDTPIGTGRISFVSPQVNSESQAILAKATFPNPEGVLRDGQLVQARVIWNRSPGISIPTIAIVPIAGQDFVYVAQQGKSQLIARQKAVKLNKTKIKDNNYPVIEGLQAGERIVVSGILNLSDGAPIVPES